MSEEAAGRLGGAATLPDGVGGDGAGPAVAGVRRLTRGMRALLVVAGVLVLLAGFQLYLFPRRTDEWFAWTIDAPMTAVFLGGSYWAAAVFEWTAARSRTWAGARVTVPAVFLFTSLTLVVTVVHIDKFHLDLSLPAPTRAVTWAWIAIYSVVPVLMAVVWFRQVRVPGTDPRRTQRLPAWLRGVVVAQAVLFVVVGAMLLVDPDWVAGWWPWPLTPLTGRAVGAWVLSLGIAAAHAAWEDDLARVRPAAAADVAFAALQAVALARHGDQLTWRSVSSWAYVAVLGVMGLIGATVLAAGREPEGVGRRA